MKDDPVTSKGNIPPSPSIARRGQKKTTLADPEETRRLILLCTFPFAILALLNALYLEPLAKRGVIWFWIADVTHFVFIPVVMMLALLKIGAIQPSQYGFRPLSSGASNTDAVGLYVFVCVVLYIAYRPVEAIAYRFLWPYAGTFGAWTMLPESGLQRIAGVLYLSITAGLVEEAVFRGLPWLYLSTFVHFRRRVPVYVISTSLLFSLVHSEQGPHGMLAALSFGLVAAILYLKIRTLWPIAIGHVTTDIIGFW